MAVTKQVYTALAEPSWTNIQLADDVFKPAFIDAGLMTDWHDSFVISNRQWRVLKIDYDNTKTYGTTYYYIGFAINDGPGICMATGWNTTTKTPTGTQFLDFHVNPSVVNNLSTVNYGSYNFAKFNPSSSTQYRLHRYTSNADPNQSWFVCQQGTSFGRPFNILSGQSELYPWLDLNLGMIDGFSDVDPTISGLAGYITFNQQLNLRRKIGYGTALRGDVEQTFSNSRYHGCEHPSHTYVGLGCQINVTTSNTSGLTNQITSAVVIPVGRNVTNPAYTNDFIPICTELPWSPYSSDPLASDFGIYMHYSDNIITFQDRFVVDPGVEEWEVLAWANNATVVNGASATFLARVV
jgi:hypothetical protein